MKSKKGRTLIFNTLDKIRKDIRMCWELVQSSCYMQLTTGKTMPTTEKVVLRPFHETVVDAIRCATRSDFTCLVGLMLTTKIPKGHDRIIEAIDTYWGKWLEVGVSNCAPVLVALKNAILIQKAEIEAAVAEKADQEVRSFIEIGVPRLFRLFQ